MIAKQSSNGIKVFLTSRVPDTDPPISVICCRTICHRLACMHLKGSHMKNKALFSTLFVVLLCSYAEFAVRPAKASNLDLIPQEQQGLSPEKTEPLPATG